MKVARLEMRHHEFVLFTYIGQILNPVCHCVAGSTALNITVCIYCVIVCAGGGNAQQPGGALWEKRKIQRSRTAV